MKASRNINRSRNVIATAAFEALEERRMFDDNALSTATALGTLDHAVSVSDVVNAGDIQDFYSLQHPGGRFKAFITNSTQPVTLELGRDTNGNGQPDSAEVIVAPGAVNPSLDINNLAAGNYFIGVLRQTADTDYTLTASPRADVGGSDLARTPLRAGPEITRECRPDGFGLSAYSSLTRE